MAVKMLLLSTGNSCRSQMAEAWTRHLHRKAIEPHSAGTKPFSRGIGSDGYEFAKLITRRSLVQIQSPLLPMPKGLATMQVPFALAKKC